MTETTQIPPYRLDAGFTWQLQNDEARQFVVTTGGVPVEASA